MENTQGPCTAAAVRQEMDKVIPKLDESFLNATITHSSDWELLAMEAFAQTGHAENWAIIYGFVASHQKVPNKLVMLQEEYFGGL